MESKREDCFSQGLCRRPRPKPLRQLLLAASLCLIVFISFKIGVSFGITGIKAYQGFPWIAAAAQKRTLQWGKSQQDILKEVYDTMEPRKRGHDDNLATGSF